MKVTIAGGGMIGLCTAMLLADDGHEVVVVERDGAPPPDPLDAWYSWERKGVNQFRLAHFFLSRFRTVAETELPQLAAALTAAGACRFNIAHNIPDEMKGGARPDDDRFDALTGRRATVEAATSHTCEETPNVEIRRGVAVKGLQTGTPGRTGVPHVTGVELDSGEGISSDLVIDATGRRSPLPQWLEAIGAARPADDLDDCGFIYYGRHFRSPSGTLPPMIGPLRQDYGCLSCLTLPADNGTWSVTLIASSRDAAMRDVRDPQRFESVVKLLPLAAHWLDGEPIDETVAFMGKIEDRIRDFAPGGEPVATGVLAVADSWACTNPSLGRGASLGLVHAVALRDLLRQTEADNPARLATDWAEVTSAEAEPWFRSTVDYDRHRLAEIQADIEGRPYASEDAEWSLVKGVETHSMMDGDILRANLDVAMVLRTPAEVFSDEKLVNLLEERRVDQAAPMGPERSQVLAALTG
jgi:2-polyprenyl-6-methoxyphenol hydroxylase-like FAD-dependent oxidoreductase